MELTIATLSRFITKALLLQSSHADLCPDQIQGRAELAYSPPQFPSPWMDPKASGWEEAYAKAREFVSQLTLLEKVNITTGTG